MHNKKLLTKSNYTLITAIIIILFIVFNIIAINFSFEDRLFHNNKTQLPKIHNQLPVFEVKDSTYKTKCDYIIITGKDTNKKALNVVQTTLQNVQKTYYVFQNFEDIPTQLSKSVKAIISVSNTENIESSIEFIKEYLLNSGKIVFASLPVKSIQENDEIRKMFGIKSLEPKRQQQGVHLLEGLLIGGPIYFGTEEIYAYDVQLMSTCKTYAQEYVKQKKLDNTKYNQSNALIWRNYWNSGEVQIVNGNFFDFSYSSGLLVSLLSFMEEIYLYPIVNTNIFSVQKFPLVTNINSQVLKEYYHRNTHQAMAEVVWPSLLSVSTSNQLPITAYFSSQLGDNAYDISISKEDLLFYIKEFAKRGFELGVELKFDTETERIESFNLLNFLITSLNTKQYYSALNLSASNNIKSFSTLNNFSVVAKDIPPSVITSRVGMYNDTSLIAPITTSGYSLNTMNDLTMRSYITTSGYLHHKIDLSNFYERLTDEDDWSNITEKISSMVHDYCKKYNWLGKDTLLKGALKIETYLLQNPTIAFENSILTVSSEVGGGCFIVRSYHNNIKVEGGSVKKIENGIFLVEMTGKSMKIFSE